MGGPSKAVPALSRRLLVGARRPAERILLQLGVDLRPWGQAHRAIWYLNRAIRLNSKNAKLYHQRGSLIIALGQPERAVQGFNEAIRLDPWLAAGYVNRAIALTLLGKDLEAERDTGLAVQLGIARSVLEEKIAELKQQR